MSAPLPEVATLFVFGRVWRGNEVEFALFGQHRSLLTPSGKPVNSACKASAIGEHREVGDADLVDAVVRGAHEELGLDVGPGQVVQVGAPVATQKSVNTVFLLDTLTDARRFRCGEGSTAIIPFRDLPAYVKQGFLTEATFTTALTFHDFVRQGRHRALATQGLAEAVEAFERVLPHRYEVDRAVLEGQLMSLTPAEIEMVHAARRMPPGVARLALALAEDELEKNR